jgi:hypothetical protein
MTNARRALVESADFLAIVNLLADIGEVASKGDYLPFSNQITWRQSDCRIISRINEEARIKKPARYLLSPIFNHRYPDQ